MSTYQIIGTIIGSISAIAIIWGGISAFMKLSFKLGEYKGRLDASKEETNSKIDSLNSSFMTFSKETNIKLDSISERLSKVEGKLEK